MTHFHKTSYKSYVTGEESDAVLSIPCEINNNMADLRICEATVTGAPSALGLEFMRINP